RLAAPRERALDQLEPLALRPAQDQPSGRQPAADPESPERLRDRPEAITRERRFLEPLVRGEAVHTRLQLRQEVARLGKGRHQRADELAIPLGGGPAVAGREAPAHVGEGARREAGPYAHRPGAPADPEHVLDGVFRLPRPGGGPERAEVAA